MCHRVLAEGDALIVGSDGLAEQEDPTGALFGYERLTQVCRTATGSALEVANAVLAAVAGHARSQPPSDDRTLLVLVRDDADTGGRS